jgi:hypothetical protein
MAKLPTLKSAKRKAKAATAQADGISPNPMTNLLIADLALRGGGQLLRHAIERTVLGAKFTPDKAKKIVKGRSMVQTLIGTAAARIATRSVPGAIVVGGGLLAKALYDRREGKRAARASGTRAIDAQAKRGDEDDSTT